MIGDNLLREKLSRVRIKTKLMLVFMALIFISVGLVSVIIYQNTMRILEKRVEQSTEMAIGQASSFLSYKMDNVKDVSSILFMNKELNDTLNSGRVELPLARQIDDYHKILNILRSAQTSREIYSIRLFTDSTNIYARENSTIFALSDIQDEAWYKEMLANREGLYCQSTYEYDYLGERGKQNVVTCSRALYSDGFVGDIMAVLSIDILEESFQDIMKKAQITREGKVYITDRADRIVSSVDPADIGQAIDSVDVRAYIVSSLPIAGTSWQVVAHIPKGELYAESRQWSYQLYGLLFIVCIFGVILAVAFSEGLTRRIGPLLQQIKKIEAENWDSQTQVTAHDEIGVLQSHLNQMSVNMRRLIEEKYKTEAEKRTAQLQALHAQINPHFLYNTMDLIHWMALEKGAKDISEVAGQLSDFFRISLSQGHDVISIADEVEHARTYLNIQSRRFGGNIQFIIETDPELLRHKTVKLILQPIVENAIQHGIREKRDKSGEIRITGQLSGDYARFIIEDDGVGMSAEKLEQLGSDSPDVGYGIRNVKDKLRLYFGETAGVAFERREERGIRVTIVFPLGARDEKSFDDNSGNSQ
ncbi:sensor histidine kinase [Paenibacillus sp. 1011MAR3C5]|uniref:cache domain-containing sensor histidine kinase n=1 Tax=Paenibacillus sp. 1011MAR3C5 TaxID=1675787 RepID=UPI000E6B8EAD|nr:sensor histidine kinase [Paenibacillus sp. 1011MAR3C5]RJE83967.1 sensor histidine kinase [Paenibacillus sp. 1011MAR3C5]